MKVFVLPRWALAVGGETEIAVMIGVGVGVGVVGVLERTNNANAVFSISVTAFTCGCVMLGLL